MSNITELFGISTQHETVNWDRVLSEQHCPYIGRKCVKVRKSQPEISIGTCSIKYGSHTSQDIVICPHRLLGRGQIFIDCLHLLTLHEPGNELHRIPEIEIPGGNVDYFLVSAREGKVVDFVGIELQALDTTGTLWPIRQQFLAEKGLQIDDIEEKKTYGINWKMTAKTTLVQLHHKIETFEGLGKHLVLVLQDALLDYMRREFNFQHIQTAKLGNSMHFHTYSLEADKQDYKLKLSQRISTDSQGVAAALGLQVNPNIELETLIQALESKISSDTILIL